MFYLCLCASCIIGTCAVQPACWWIPHCVIIVIIVHDIVLVLVHTPMRKTVRKVMNFAFYAWWIFLWQTINYTLSRETFAPWNVLVCVFNYNILNLLCIYATVHNFAISHDLVCHDTLKNIGVNYEKIKPQRKIWKINPRQHTCNTEHFSPILIFWFCFKL
jgi:hypothetical protein